MTNKFSVGDIVIATFKKAPAIVTRLSNKKCMLLFADGSMSEEWQESVAPVETTAHIQQIKQKYLATVADLASFRG